MKSFAAVLVLVVALAAVPGVPVCAQETQTEPAPLPPVAPQQTVPPPPVPPKQAPAPIERRPPHPNATDIEPVAGPLAPPGESSTPATTSQQPVNRSGPVETLHVQTRLVNVALTVVDANGAPVGGFDRSSFQIFEDGEPQKTAIFERDDTSPLSIVLAIDSSETVLTSDRLEREAAKHFVRAILRPQDQIALFDFADTVREIVPFTNQARHIEQGLGELQQGDETALYNAIYLASESLGATSRAANRRRVLVVISDGGDSVHGKVYEQAIEQAQRADTMIYSIIIVPIAADAGRNTGGEHTMIQMARDTGGRYFYVQDPSDLEPAFRQISEDLRTQYVLGYYAPQSNGGTAFRSIKVVLTDPALREKYSLRYRPGYYADAR